MRGFQTVQLFATRDSPIGVSSPWHRSLSREQWRVLVASNLGWLFDGFEIYALFLTVGFALPQLLYAAQYPQTPRYAGYVLATTVFGWATGGVIGGIVADYIGRKRTMMLAVLAYTLTTGLSAIAWNWESFAILRFLVGVGIGSEWVTGTSLVSEIWPDHARGRGGGLLQSGAGIGSFLASAVWLLIGDLGPSAWRFMFPSSTGKPTDDRWLRDRVWQPLLRRARLRHRGIHQLRHSYASLLLGRGVPPKYVQGQLGHASLAVTLSVYSHLLPGEYGRLADQLDAPDGTTIRNLSATGENVSGAER